MEKVRPSKRSNTITARLKPYITQEARIALLETNGNLIHFGMGACRSCGCKGYKKDPSGEGRWCGDCGHHYDQHY